MDPQGRVVIPAELRGALGPEAGEVPIGLRENERLILERRATILERLRALFAARNPCGLSLVDELIEDRRTAARDESATL